MNRKDFPEAMEKIFMNSNRSTRRGLSQSPSGSATIHSPLSRVQRTLQDTVDVKFFYKSPSRAVKYIMIDVNKMIERNYQMWGRGRISDDLTWASSVPGEREDFRHVGLLIGG